MKKKILFVGFALLGSCFALHAQFGINTSDPDPSAYLHVQGKAGGVLFPTLTISERDEIVQPARGLIIFNSETLNMEQNIGTADIPVWRALGSSAPSWFYMPVTPIDVSLPDNTYTVDLYAEYKKQFTEATLPEGVESTVIPAVYAVDQLDYIILGYDKSVFSEVVVTEQGILTYKAIPYNVTDSTYFNVIFKIK